MDNIFPTLFREVRDHLPKMTSPLDGYACHLKLLCWHSGLYISFLNDLCHPGTPREFEELWAVGDYTMAKMIRPSLPKSPRLYNGTLFLLPLRGRVYFPTLNRSWSCGLLWSVEGGGPGLSLASRGPVPFCSLLGTLPSCHVNEPGLALWRTTPWGAERSHPSWGYPSPASPQPTWQWAADGWDGWVSPGGDPKKHRDEPHPSCQSTKS